MTPGGGIADTDDMDNYVEKEFCNERSEAIKDKIESLEKHIDDRLDEISKKLDKTNGSKAMRWMVILSLGLITAMITTIGVVASIVNSIGK